MKNPKPRDEQRDLETFARRIGEARQRVAELEARAGESGPEQGGILAEALYELRTRMEELSVAEEELRVAGEELHQQNEALEAAQRAVGAERWRYLDLFESAPDAYLVTDTDGLILEANRAAARLLNVPDAMIARKPLALFGAGHEDQRRLRRMLTGLLRPGTPREEDVRLRPRCGEPVDAAAAVSGVCDPEGRMSGARWLFRDITARKRAEEELAQLNEELETRVAERTARLEAADRAKDQFLATLAHELRNPLNVMLTSVDLLKRLPEGDPRRARTKQTLERQIRHQARLVDDLLNVSRVARGKIVLQRRELDLGRLARDVAADWRKAVEEAGLTLEVSVPDAPLRVNGDATRLSQVLENLVQNAIKFTEPGGRIRLAVERRETGDGGPAAGGRGQEAGGTEPGSRLPSPVAVVTVRDTGVGIDPDLLPHLFEAFSQADRSLDRTKGGLGLGLALVKGLVGLHGGRVSARSEGFGKGSEFRIELPLVERSTFNVQRSEAAALNVERGTLNASRRVLVIDDSADTTQVVRDLLEMEGHAVATAASGPEGIEIARRFQPDVVLCDIGLPGMDGYEVACRLRADPATAGARLVAVSGYAREEDRRRSAEAGFDAHLAKPVGLSELQRALGEA